MPGVSTCMRYSHKWKTHCGAQFPKTMLRMYIYRWEIWERMWAWWRIARSLVSRWAKDWSRPTSGAGYKGMSWDFFLRKLWSFNVWRYWRCSTSLLLTVHRTSLLLRKQHWSRRHQTDFTNWLRPTGSIIGLKLDSLKKVVERGHWRKNNSYPDQPFHLTSEHFSQQTHVTRTDTWDYCCLLQ